MIFLKIILIVGLLGIVYQDLKERQVYWFLFPIVGLSSGILFYSSTFTEMYIITVVFNLLMVSIILGALYVFLRIRKKTFKNAIGSGDILLFMVLALSFSNVSFYVIFTCSLIFSLLIHLILYKQNIKKGIPVAGYVSAFFMITFISFWFGAIDNLYSL